MPPKIVHERCTSCGDCERVCPGDIIHATANGPVVRYPDECSHCGLCVSACPTHAVEIHFSWNMLQLPIELTRRERGTDA